MGALLMALSIVCFIVLPWLDRSQGEVHALPPAHLEDRAGGIRGVVHRTGLPGPEARRGHIRVPRPVVHRAVLRVLRADAVLHAR